MNKLLSLLFPLAILISGCNLEEMQNQQINLQEERIFTASFEQNETRTYVENGNLLRWNAGDQISLFDGNTLNRQYQFDGETGDNSGTFSIVSKPFGTGNDLNCHYSVYPYASDVKITESGVITVILPADQNYAENSFGLGANTMVAVTKDIDDTFLKFKNVGGYLKLQLYGDDVVVKSISLTGNSNEKIAGKASIIPTYSDEPQISMSDDATSCITLNCGEGVKIGSTAETSTAFWIVVPPTTFESGFTITITDINGKTFTKETSNKITIERNVIKPMKAFEVTTEEEEGTIPPNQIWYTATAKVEPLYNNVFGANIVLNTWDSTSGNGIITFDSEVTSIGTYAFYSKRELTGIRIPNSVTIIDEKAFAECVSLNDLIIPSSVTSIKSNAFYATGITDITIPDGVISIGAGAFDACYSLTSVFVPSSVTSIEYSPFTSCPSLINITVDELNQVYDSRNNCNAIIETSKNKLICGSSNTIIPNNITVIGYTAFVNCYSLEHITIPDSVTEIEPAAFANCTSLSRVDVEAETPPTMHRDNTFSNCNEDLTFYVPTESLEAYKAANYWKNLTIIEKEIQIKAVDLGLGVKWASCNVGADSPEKAGGYYSWGETEEKSNYDHSNYLWSNQDYMNWKMTKYCTTSEYGTVDNKTVLDLPDDVANVKYGDGWRMPTIDEFQELLNNCSWEWTSMNGVNGYKISGNGNSIFLPAAGCRYYDETEVRYFSELGAYWSSSLNDEASDAAWGFSFEETDIYEKDRVSRYPGSTIRPVKE